MKKTNRNILFLMLIMSVGIIGQMHSQVDDSGLVIDSSVDKDDVPYLLNGIEKLFEDYRRNADFLDEGNGGFSPDKAGIFVDLFGQDATIAEDYLRYPQSKLVDFAGYIEAVVSNFSDSGLPFEIKNIQWVNVTYVSAELEYQMEVEAEKEMMYLLDEGNQKIENTEGIDFPLTFLVAVKEYELTKPYIKSISIREEILPPSEPEDVAVNDVMEEPEPETEEIATTEPKEEVEPIPEEIVVEPAKEEVMVEAPMDTLKELEIIVSGSHFQTGIDAEKKEKILSTLEKAIIRYSDVADLFDSELQQVGGEKLSQFENLFATNAKIYNDLSEFPDPIPMVYNNYIDQVYQFLPDKGVLFELGSIRLDSVYFDQAGYFQADLLVEKKMYNYLTAEKRPGVYPKGRILNLKFRYDIPEFNLSEARITGIETQDFQCPPEEEETYFILSGTYFLGSLNATTNIAWNNFNSSGSGSLDPAVTSSFGAGLTWQSNSFYPAGNCKKPLFLELGIHFNRASIDTEVSDYVYGEEIQVQNSGFPGPVAQREVRETSIGKSDIVTETSQLDLVVASLGVNYRLIKGFKYRLFLGLGVRPMYSLSTTYNYGQNDKVYYDGLIEFMGTTVRVSNETPLEQFTNSNNNQRNLGVNSLRSPNSDNSLDSKFGLSAYASLNFHFDLTYNFGLLAGLNYNYGIISPIATYSNPEERIYEVGNNSDSGRSFLSNYFDEVSINQLGLRVGIYYKIRS